jgi:hypothetical protein
VPPSCCQVSTCRLLTSHSPTHQHTRTFSIIKAERGMHLFCLCLRQPRSSISCMSQGVATLQSPSRTYQRWQSKGNIEGKYSAGCSSLHIAYDQTHQWHMHVASRTTACFTEANKQGRVGSCCTDDTQTSGRAGTWVLLQHRAAAPATKAPPVPPAATHTPVHNTARRPVPGK